MRKVIVIFVLFLVVSCKSTKYNDGLGFFTDEMHEYLMKKEYYGGINSQIVRIRHLYYEHERDSLFVSFNCFQNNYPELDTVHLYSGFSTSFTNSISVLNQHNIYSYNQNNYTDSLNFKFVNGIEYIIQIEDTINVSYFFNFEEMDNNIRKMDFELLPNMIGKRKNAIQH